jgi:hypothetical protein
MLSEASGAAGAADASAAQVGGIGRGATGKKRDFGSISSSESSDVASLLSFCTAALGVRERLRLCARSSSSSPLSKRSLRADQPPPGAGDPLSESSSRSAVEMYEEDAALDSGDGERRARLRCGCDFLLDEDAPLFIPPPFDGFAACFIPFFFRRPFFWNVKVNAVVASCDEAASDSSLSDASADDDAAEAEAEELLPRWLDEEPPPSPSSPSAAPGRDRSPWLTTAESARRRRAR